MIWRNESPRLLLCGIGFISRPVASGGRGWMDMWDRKWRHWCRWRIVGLVLLIQVVEVAVGMRVRCVRVVLGWGRWGGITSMVVPRGRSARYSNPRKLVTGWMVMRHGSAREGRRTRRSCARSKIPLYMRLVRIEWAIESGEREARRRCAWWTSRTWGGGTGPGSLRLTDLGISHPSIPCGT